MSEYQQYEFRVVDRALTRDELAVIRTISSRAEISATSFSNFYNYGDFHGDAIEMMANWYDIHVYTANWGTRFLMFALPANVVELATIETYCTSRGSRVHDRGERQVLSYFLEEYEGDDYETEAESWIADLTPLRAEIINGDYRALYLGWLHAIQMELGFAPFEEDESEEELAAQELEPPVPPGLRNLTPAQEAMAAFLNISPELVAVAAEASPDLVSTEPTASDLLAWIRSQPAAVRDEILLHFLLGDQPNQRTGLLKRIHDARTVPSQPAQPLRTIDHLLGNALTRIEERERLAEEKAAAERKRKADAAARARSDYLDGIRRNPERLWAEIDRLIVGANANAYNQAIGHLLDLQEIADADNETEAFRRRLSGLRSVNSLKIRFLDRLEDAGL